MGAGVPFPGAQPPFAGPTGPAVVAPPVAPMPQVPPKPKHKHHKKHSGRGSDNETGRRRNERGGGKP